MRISKGFIILFSAAFFWAISIILTRLVLKAGENAYTLNFMSCLFTLPYWIWILRENTPSLRRFTPFDWKLVIAMGTISGFLSSIIEVFAIKYGQAVNYAFLNRTTVLFTIIFAYIFLGEEITRKKVILLIMILTGAYLLTTQGRMMHISIGDIFTLIQASLIAFGNTVLGKMSSKTINPNVAAGMTSIIGIVGGFILALIFGAIHWPTMATIIFGIAILSTAITHLRFFAYQYVSASFCTMIFSFTPVFVCIMAFLFLGESLTMIQLIGGALTVIAGIFVEKLNL
jgi:drug/metabolite transporter (DMT)-like permease